jgi:hypothetical protein
MGPAPLGPFLKMCLNGKFSSLHRKLVREEQEGGVLVPLLLHQEGGWDTGPCPPQIYAMI